MDSRLKSVVRGGLFGLLGVAAVAAAATFTLYSPANGVQCNTGSTYANTACTASAVPAAGSTTQMIYNLGGVYAGNAQATVASDLGIIIGSATGGSKGPGTLNATALYVNGSPVGISGGAVSSVGLALPSSVFIVTGSPVTSAGTLTGAFQTQTANTVWAGPTTGAATTPTFRALVAADLPATAVTPGSYTNTNLTVDQQGRITAASNGASGATGANPTGLIGLTAVNGSATTFTRSDSTHALDQSIAPTWTGQHIFTGTVSLSSLLSGISIGNDGSTTTRISWLNSHAPANSKTWYMDDDVSGSFSLNMANDAVNAFKNVFAISRTGIVVTGIAIGNASDLPAITLDGPVTIAANSSAASITSNAGANERGLIVQGSATTGQSYGVWVLAGTNGSDLPLLVTNTGNTANLLAVFGDGHFSIGYNGSSGDLFSTAAGNLTMNAPTSGATLSINGAAGANPAVLITSGSSSTTAASDFEITRAGSTANALAEGASLNFTDSVGSTGSTIQHSGGQTELWQFNGSWSEIFRVTSARAVEFAAPSGGPFAICTTATCGTVLFQVQSSGSIGMPFLGVTSSAQSGYVCWSSSGGALTVDTSNTCLVSSQRYKDHIQDLDEGLDAVMQLHPVTYRYKKDFMPAKFDPGEQIGFVAEDVQKIDPRLTPLDKDGLPRGVEYDRITALLTNAVQEQQHEIDDLRRQLKSRTH